MVNESQDSKIRSIRVQCRCPEHFLLQCHLSFTSFAHWLAAVTLRDGLICVKNDHARSQQWGTFFKSKEHDGLVSPDKVSSSPTIP